MYMHTIYVHIEIKFLSCFSIAQSVHKQGISLLVQIFSLILDSSVGLSAGIQSAGDFESCIQQRKTTCLLSIRKWLACARASKLTTTNMYVCVYVCMYVCVYVRTFMYLCI